MARIWAAGGVGAQIWIRAGIGVKARHGICFSTGVGIGSGARQVWDWDGIKYKIMSVSKCGGRLRPGSGLSLD